MVTVSVSELKANLSRYLRTIKRGGEVQVIERGVPIAMLTPISHEAEGNERKERLIRSGVIRAGTGTWTPDDQPPVKLKTSLVEALSEDREDRL